MSKLNNRQTTASQYDRDIPAIIDTRMVVPNTRSSEAVGDLIGDPNFLAFARLVIAHGEATVVETLAGIQLGRCVAAQGNIVVGRRDNEPQTLEGAQRAGLALYGVAHLIRSLIENEKAPNGDTLVIDDRFITADEAAELL